MPRRIIHHNFERKKKHIQRAANFNRLQRKMTTHTLLVYHRIYDDDEEWLVMVEHHHANADISSKDIFRCRKSPHTMMVEGKNAESVF